MADNNTVLRPGIYSKDYFSGSACALYIGDVWVDEVVSLSVQVNQNKKPLYGYKDQYFRQVARGQILVQGEFTINFKEAGYLWLILNRYKNMMGDKDLGPVPPFETNPFSLYKKTDRKSKEFENGYNIEQIVNGELTTSSLNRILKGAVENIITGNPKQVANNWSARINGKSQLGQASLLGYADTTRSSRNIGDAENIFETFENAIWQNSQENLDTAHRRPDDDYLNGFDIYVIFGDYNSNDKLNHTMFKISDVHILGSVKSVESNANPIMETYSFIARNIV